MTKRDHYDRRCDTQTIYRLSPDGSTVLEMIINADQRIPDGWQDREAMAAEVAALAKADPEAAAKREAEAARAAVAAQDAADAAARDAAAQAELDAEAAAAAPKGNDLSALAGDIVQPIEG